MISEGIVPDVPVHNSFEALGRTEKKNVGVAHRPKNEPTLRLAKIKQVLVRKLTRGLVPTKLGPFKSCRPRKEKMEEGEKNEMPAEASHKSTFQAYAR